MAPWMKASETSRRCWKSRTSLRQRVIHPKVRSTTQRRGSTLKPGSLSIRRTTSITKSRMRALSMSAVRLRVRPTYALPMGGGDPMFSIEVVNLSTFAVTITEVGFTVDGRTTKKTRAGIPQPLIIDGQPWPRRLQQREAVSAFFHPGEAMRAGGWIGRAYAHTSCGEFAYGTSPAFRELSDIVDQSRSRK